MFIYEAIQDTARYIYLAFVKVHAVHKSKNVFLYIIRIFFFFQNDPIPRAACCDEGLLKKSLGLKIHIRFNAFRENE